MRGSLNETQKEVTRCIPRQSEYPRVDDKINLVLTELAYFFTNSK